MSDLWGSLHPRFDDESAKVVLGTGLNLHNMTAETHLIRHRSLNRTEAFFDGLAIQRLHARSAEMTAR